MISFEHKYKIGDRVYYDLPESQMGIVIDVSYLVSTGEVKYCVGIGFDNEVWCLERELTIEKQIV